MSRLKLICGPCAIENRDTAFQIAEHVVGICEKLDIEYVFKGSYRKANRTSLNSFTGIGDLEALKILEEVGTTFNVPVLTDVHESTEVSQVASQVDYLQIPAFLCRQTDLLIAAGESGKGIHIKKGQFLSPESMSFAVEKIQSTGNENIWVCERGTTFGYQDLVVDATSIPRMKAFADTVIMDCTHATQRPNQTAGVTGGNPEMISSLAMSAIATGADGLFIESHPDPAKAMSDGATMLQLSSLEAIITRANRLFHFLRED